VFCVLSAANAFVFSLIASKIILHLQQKNIHANGLMTLKHWGLIFFILYPDKSP
jgi:hypothetical protein